MGISVGGYDRELREFRLGLGDLEESTKKTGDLAVPWILSGNRGNFTIILITYLEGKEE